MTKLYGVIGDPISHSLSALMQNRALSQAHLDAVYLPFHVASQELGAFIEAARRWPCHGFNVTIPHKQNIIPYLDEINEEASRIGAVNTVLNEDGRLRGTNTDAVGFLRSLREEACFDPKGRYAVILGAGGAAHAISYGLLEAGIERLTVFNRTASRANSLKNELMPYFPHRIDVKDWEADALRDVFHESQLLVNATSVGLNGSRFDELPLSELHSKCLVADLVYRPRQTPLLKSAASLGLQTLEGVGMLVFQGAASFEIWTGVTPDATAMRAILLDALDREIQSND